MLSKFFLLRYDIEVYFDINDKYSTVAFMRCQVDFKTCQDIRFRLTKGHKVAAKMPDKVVYQGF